jgi:hypothetical protein
MRRCSRRQAAIKRNAVALMAALVGLMGLAACAGPPRNLSDPAKFRILEHTLRTDLTKVADDYKREQGVGVHRRHVSICYNLKNNVNSVVLNTIRNFVLGTVTADRNTMQANINHMRSDISSFEKDITDFINDGVAGPSGAKRAIRDMTTTTSHAITHANSTISAVNDIVRNAYGFANHLALVGCPGAGPGTQMPRVARVT